MKKKILLILFFLLTGLIIGLLVTSGLITGCTEPARELQPEILNVVSRTPVLNATGVSSTESLSITFKFPIDHRGMTKDNFFTEYAEFGSSHTAGTPEITALEFSSDSKTLTITLSGWGAALTAETVVHIIPRSGKIKDIFGNAVKTTTVLCKYNLAYTPTATVLVSFSGAVTFDGPGTPVVPNIILNLDDATQVATTDADGAFIFTAEAGSYTITPTKSGWVFNPSSLTVSSSTSAANFAASIEGWTVTQFSGITHDLYGIAYTEDQGGTDYVMVGSGGMAYTSSDGLNWDPFTHDDIIGAGDFIHCIIMYEDSNYVVIISAKSKTYRYRQATLPSGDDVLGTIDYSSFTDQAEDISLLVGPTDDAAFFMATSGGLHHNSDYDATPEAFGANLAPGGMMVRSVSGVYGGPSPNYYALIGGDDGDLYWYAGAASPTSSDWTALTSGTTEKITGIGSISDGIISFVTESGSAGYATITVNGSVLECSDWQILFSGLPYSLYGVTQTTSDTEISGMTVVGSDGLYLKKD